MLHLIVVIGARHECWSRVRQFEEPLMKSIVPYGQLAGCPESVHSFEIVWEKLASQLKDRTGTDYESAKRRALQVFAIPMHPASLSLSSLCLRLRVHSRERQTQVMADREMAVVSRTSEAPI